MWGLTAVLAGAGLAVLVPIAALTHQQGATAARPGLVVWTVGDLCDDDNDVPGCETVADLVAADPTASYFVPLGDNQYQNGSLSNYEAYYHPKVGAKLNAITKPIPGNHEYVTPEAAGYYDYFGVKAGDPDKGYYSVSSDGWRLIFLNSRCRAFDDGCDYTSAQAEWLDDQLQGPETCEIVFTHYPPISDGEYAPGILRMGGFWRHAQQNHAELFISGHDHGYQRFAPRGAAFTEDADGVTPVVVGTGGKSLYDFSPINRSEYRQDTKFGALRLSLTPTGYSGEFVNINGTTMDSFSGSCLP
jgi:hypothetical protein